MMCGFSGGLSCALHYAKVAKDDSHFLIWFPEEAILRWIWGSTIHRHTRVSHQSDFSREAIGTLGQGVGSLVSPLLLTQS